MRYKFRNTLLVILSILLLSTSVLAKGEKTVSIGKDLNMDQRKQMLDLFGATEDDHIIEVTNQEERKYLGSHVASNVLGSRAISSSFVEVLGKGEGIKVETYNITWVTEDMLINALVTAGVKDAQVKVAAPFEVSGTAALTGILKGFEGATGEVISEEEKEVASEEIAKTGELGDEIGKDEAAQIMTKVKEEVVEKGLKTGEEIRVVIEDASKDINIELTDEQKAKIEELMVKISNLDLNIEDVKSQLKNISDRLKELSENTEEIKSVVARILDYVRSIFERIVEFFRR